MVTKLLERAIEIEGLIRIIRDGNPLPETYTLLSNKAVELAEGVMLLEERAASAEPYVAAPQVPVDETHVEEGPTIVMTEAAAESEPTGQDHVELAEAEEDDMEALPVITATDVIDPPLPAEPQPTDEEDEDDIMLTFDEEEEEADNVPSDTKEDTFIVEHAPAVEQTPLKEEEKPAAPLKRKTKLKSAFSLNDRFLYARELFDGNMKMFDSTLDFIEGIEDYSIIEDYFYSELEWNPENIAVASFMEILRPHFKD